jgi:hypothetical protein
MIAFLFREIPCMNRSLSGFRMCLPGLSRASARRGPSIAVCVLGLLLSALRVPAQSPPGAQSGAPSHSFFVDCSSPGAGDGSLAHPWSALSLAEAHTFAPGDIIALQRGTACKGAFAPQGSGSAERRIRLTAYGVGPRPKIVAPSTARQAFLLFNQQYWQVDSLDISGGNTYGVFVAGDKGKLHHLYLKNLYVHGVYGGALKNKDNGLVVVGPSSINVFFDDVLIDGVDAAHTNQWAGILVGGGSFPYKDGATLNTNVQIRDSTVHDVYGDGIVLFRDSHSSITDSAAWLTGMEPTQDVGTPNAIWTWTCYDCTVENNEAYLTDSPGVDGGAYDIDWNDHNNTVENNYAHDTQGYCIAVFGAGYVTSDSLVSGNLCVDNALSPRMAASEGAVQLSTWNGGTIRGLTIEGNTIQWNPRVPGAAAIVAPADVGQTQIVFTKNTIESTSPLIYHVKTPWQSSGNTYLLNGAPVFSIGGKQDLSLAALQSAGFEQSSHISPLADRNRISALRIDAVIDLALDSDGLLAPDARAQLVVLRSLAGQYASSRLHIAIHLPSGAPDEAETNALEDLNVVYPGVLRFARDASAQAPSIEIRLLSMDGQLLQEWSGFQNAAMLGGAVRALLGPPDYSHMQAPESTGGPQ